MKKHQIVSKILFISMVIFLVIGCTHTEVSTINIVGIWVEQRTLDDSPCGYFEFFDDGSFIAYQIPGKEFLSTLPDRMSGDGIWKIDASSKDSFAVHRVKLRFSPIEGFPQGFDSELGISVSGKTLFTGPNGKVLFKRENVEKCK